MDIMESELLLRKLMKAGLPVESLGPVGDEKLGIRFSENATREQKIEAEKIRTAFLSSDGRLARAKEQAKQQLLSEATPQLLMQLALRNAEFATKVEAIEAATSTEDIRKAINGR